MTLAPPLLQGLGGSVLLLGAYVTWRQLRHAVESGREQHELDRQGQITERLTPAADVQTALSVLGSVHGRLPPDPEATRLDLGRVGCDNCLAGPIRLARRWCPS